MLRHLLVVLLVLGLAGAASAFTLTQSHDLSAAAVLDEAGTTNDITPSVITGGYRYDWGDVNGDLTRTDPVGTAGLDVSTFKL